MNKKQATDLFRETHRSTLDRGFDKGAIRLAWNNFIDGLQKSGQISEHSAATWVNPFLHERDR
jgi:hypothetical protein